MPAAAKFLADVEQRTFSGALAVAQLYQAGANLADTGFLVCNARVHARGDAQFDHFADVNSCGRATEIERRDGEMGMLGHGDFIHLQGGIKRVLWRAANKGNDGWCRSHGKTADPRSFGDRAIPNIGVRVLAGKAGEVEPIGYLCWCREPLFAKATDAFAA